MTTIDVIKKALVKHGIPTEVDVDRFENIPALFQQAVKDHSDYPAFSSVGHTLTYGEVGEMASQFAAYLQNHTSLQPGDRIAFQIPNLIQYPVVLHGALMAGLIVVNTNPMYQPREVRHQMKDSGAKAIVVMANVAEALYEVIKDTDIEQVIVTQVVDFHPLFKRLMINNYVKYVQKAVPNIDFDNKISLRKALALGSEHVFQPVSIGREQVAALQYTGGTTGVAKGAMLTHRNLMSNVFQSSLLFDTYGIGTNTDTLLAPLPLYHIYSFLVSMIMTVKGNHTVLIPDPRNTASVVNDMDRYPMTIFCGINSLFVKLCLREDFKALDFSALKITVSGGMALTLDAARQWEAVTGTEIAQGYGLTETSPVVSVNPGSGNQVETIGLPVPSTEIKIIDQDGQDVPQGERGEICVKGPQVMAGYWQRPDATAKVIDEDGWFATGDIAIIQPDGYLKIVDRKKDMIIVSGFNVYPNELEDVLSEHPDVIECAAIGVPDPVVGETIKMFVVKAKDVSKESLHDWCDERLTGYKVPKEFEFIEELPKTSVGKILRRELR